MIDDSIAVLSCADNGELSYISSVDFPEKPTGKISDYCIFVSPDGKHLYTFLRYVQDKTAKCAGRIFKRDEKNGALSFLKNADINELTGIKQVIFLPDGKVAYYCGEAFNICGLGFLTRNPDTGDISFGGKAKGSNPAFCFDYDPNTGTIYLGGYHSQKVFKIFKAYKAHKE